ncbi:hypothetical protein CYMTET_41576 [Cymbomonas tetramitiformis]|uniref:Uncharacterized protein n=1 Tax=Cymbomonas tetramitiformis TaxID=36881 RepID=A0AAE0F1V5_9CHLO|nr:hypothetical protein CYMTET_41576 [Cymbomonas tetramitiformis]
MVQGTIKAASVQHYLSAIINYHEDMGHDGPAKSRSVTRAVKGISSLQVQTTVAQAVEESVRTWLPARHVAAVHAHRPTIRCSWPWANWEVHPEGEHFMGHSTRKGACTCAGAMADALLEI